MNNKRVFSKMVEGISMRSEAPIFVYVILLVLYLSASAIVSGAAGSDAQLSLFGMSVPVYSFAGVFSSISQICVIFMTSYCGKKGYITSLILLLAQMPFVLMGIIARHNITSLPGVFGNFLAIIAITIIYINNKRAREYQIRLRDQAVTDSLTGLPNRFALTELTKELVKKGEKFVAVSIDFNGFKSINSTMGFEVGNQVLTEIATRWRTIADTSVSGTVDFIARTSGDEFALIIRDYHKEEDIMNTIRQYESALGNRLTVDECDFYITASFGYAIYPDDTANIDSLFSYADAAMREVKRTNSSNHILRFTQDLLKVERTLEIEGKIRDALDNDTIYFNLQPQYDMDHKLRGFEALARMKDSEGNFISPGEFIPVAEKVGLIDRVDAAVFRKSAMFFGELLRKSGTDMTLSINASVRHLMKNDFLDEIQELLKSSGIPADKLEIEITESIMIDSVDKALECVNEIKNMGIKIAIDDFGTGYSSLSYLSSFPADLLKIDKSFVDKMNSSENSRQYVAAIISIGHVMGFDVIAEGVEEPAQLETLKEIGCDFIQGFIWGKPLMPDAVEELVMEKEDTN